jgi:hypothetical protein
MEVIKVKARNATEIVFASIGDMTKFHDEITQMDQNDMENL